MYFAFNLNQLYTDLLGYTLINEKYVLKERTLSDYELIIQTAGHSCFYINNEPYLLQEGSYLIIPPDTLHRAEGLSTGSFNYAHFECSAKEVWSKDEVIHTLENQQKELVSFIDQHDFFILSQPSELSLVSQYDPNLSCLERVNTLFSDCLYYRDSYRLTSPNHMTQLFRMIMTELSSALTESLEYNQVLSSKGGIHPILGDANAYIIQNINKTIRVTDLAEHLDITPQYLNKLYRLHYDCTTVMYINRLKIGYARRLIQQTNKSFQEISYELGFDNPYYFSRLFKSITKTTPSQYRRDRSGQANS